MLLRRKPATALAATASETSETSETTGPVAMSSTRNSPNFVLAAYERYSRALYGYIYRLVASSQDAEDILQEAFTRALVSCHTRPSGDDNEALVYCRRWLYQVATNLSVDLLRRRKRQPFPLDPVGESGAGADGEQTWTAPALALAAPGPELQDRVAQQQVIAETFAHLRPDDVSVLLLFEHAGFALSEIAVLVGCSPAAAAKKVARARKRFVRAYQHLAREEVSG